MHSLNATERAAHIAAQTEKHKFWVNSDDATCTGLPRRNSTWLTSEPTLEWLRDQHIVFFGDSRTRAEYMSLAHLVLHGHPPHWEMSERAGAAVVAKAGGGGGDSSDKPPDKKSDYNGYFAWWFNKWSSMLASDRGSEFS